MLLKVKDLMGSQLHLLTGEVGKIEAFYFDDNYWTIRYLVAETGSWLQSRTVLISPSALSGFNLKEKKFLLNVTKAELEGSPAFERNQPISAEFQRSYFSYYGWPAYWLETEVGNPYSYEYPNLNKPSFTEGLTSKEVNTLDHHLRNTTEVHGYHMEAIDGEIGHISDYVIEADSWTVKYFIVSTMNWWPGKHVLVPPHLVKDISWTDSKVFLSISRETLKNAPLYTEDILLSLEYEAEVARYYGKEEFLNKHEFLMDPVV